MYVIECNILSYIVLIAEVEWFWLNRGGILVSNLIKKNNDEINFNEVTDVIKYNFMTYELKMDIMKAIECQTLTIRPIIVEIE